MTRPPKAMQSALSVVNGKHHAIEEPVAQASVLTRASRRWPRSSPPRRSAAAPLRWVRAPFGRESELPFLRNRSAQTASRQIGAGGGGIGCGLRKLGVVELGRELADLLQPRFLARRSAAPARLGRCRYGRVRRACARPGNVRSSVFEEGEHRPPRRSRSNAKAGAGSILNDGVFSLKRAAAPKNRVRAASRRSAPR